jgi:hypothetical protein
MNTKKIIISTIALTLGILVVHSHVSAATVSVKANADAKLVTRTSAIITRSDTAITARIGKLTELSTRIAGMKNVSDATKQALSATIQTNIDGLNALKTKIDAETDITMLTADEKTITGGYRIYALVVPQGWIVASSDRVNTIASLLTGVSTKLQARITTMQTAGQDVTKAQALLTDLNAKVADAQAQGATALSTTASLKPDQGDKTLAASNTAALKAAKANIKTATADLQAARMDAKNIIASFKTSASLKAKTTTKNTQ